MENARDISARILLKIEMDNAYSSLSLNEALRGETAGSRDAAFVTSLVYGVCERKITLDYNISLYLRSPLKKLHPAVLTCLRLGACQILFLDRIPDRAAINESVELAKRFKVGFASGLINAILRKISAAGLVLPKKTDIIRYNSVLYSCPEELVRFFTAAYGEKKAEKILGCSIGRRPVFIRVNTLKTSPERLSAALAERGVTTALTELPGCLTVENTGDISALPEYADGDFFVQDKSSQLDCLMLGAEPGDTVVDCCAAPGGKTYSAAVDMQDKGVIYSCDIYPHKTDLIEKGAQRLGLTCVKTVCTDARKLRYSAVRADRVLCDVPCSGLGVIGRKPEIRYKPLDSFGELPALQLDILESCSELVKNGGTLVYSTCTLNPAENDGVCDEFLRRHPDFSVCADGRYAEMCGGRKYLTVFPSETGGDGFFTAKFIRSV